MVGPLYCRRLIQVVGLPLIDSLTSHTYNAVMPSSQRGVPSITVRRPSQYGVRDGPA